MISPPRATKSPRVQRVSVRNWLSGYGSTQDLGRTDQNGLSAAEGVLLHQDGVIGPWPSMVKYGPSPPGVILGEIGEFREIEGHERTNWLITVQDVEGVVEVYIRKDTEDWIRCEGKTYDPAVRAHFSQIDDKVLVTNGEDNLSYLDVFTKIVTPFIEIPTPTGLSVSQTGMTGSTHTIKVKVTASNQGQTAASSSVSVTVSKLRGSWDGSSEYLTITANRVTGANYYHIYLADTAGGEEFFLATVPDPGSGSTFSFVDLGLVDIDPTRPAPVGDTSAGPKATRSWVINGQVFLTGDKDEPRSVRYGGTTKGKELDFSPFGGGGSSEVGAGGKEIPVVMKSFRNAQGIPTITCLCQSTGGKGKRYTFTPATLTIGSTTISYFKVEEDNGEKGTDAPDGVLKENDALWYPSIEGFHSTYTKQQLQTILSTEKVSGKIEKDVNNINLKALENAVSTVYKGRLYWGLAVGSDKNNQIWTLDPERGGGWMLPRNVAADWLMVYGSNDGESRFLVLSNNEIFEFSDSVFTNDNGNAFSTYIKSGLIGFSKDMQEFAKVLYVTFILLRPRGEIEMKISGLTEDAELETTVGTKTFTSIPDIAGWDEFPWGFIPEWGANEIVPSGSSVTRVGKTIEVDEELQWFFWELSSKKKGVGYAVSDVIVEFVNIGTKDQTE